MNISKNGWSIYKTILLEIRWYVNYEWMMNDELY